jgi:hypothetical protein
MKCVSASKPAAVSGDGLMSFRRSAPPAPDVKYCEGYALATNIVLYALTH